MAINSIINVRLISIMQHSAIHVYVKQMHNLLAHNRPFLLHIRFARERFVVCSTHFVC